MNTTATQASRPTRRQMADQAAAIRCEARLMYEAAKLTGGLHEMLGTDAWRQLEQDLEATLAWLRNN